MAINLKNNGSKKDCFLNDNAKKNCFRDAKIFLLKVMGNIQNILK